MSADPSAIFNPVSLATDGWLSARLGKPAFHVQGLPGDLSGLEDHPKRAPQFIDAKVRADDDGSVRGLQDCGFRLIDTNLRFERSRDGIAAPSRGEVGFARPGMVDAVGGVAERAFVHDRFHRDPAVPHGVAALLKRDWARNFFSGQRGEWMVVAEVEGSVAGFLQLLRSRKDELVIDLIAVDAPFRGRGLAAGMIAFANDHCPCKGALAVGTQAVNIPSVRLYENLGFRLAAAQYVFHFHGAES